MSGLPVLSIITWAPFAAALVIMGFGRTRPQLVRWAAAIGVAVSCAGALWIFQAYDNAAAGFQFGERFDLVPSLGIAYELAADGMSVVMVLLTAIIILAGVFASWTIKTRDQEFYALLLLLVTGVFGVFVSLDLFVFFLFYEIAVLPMYLLIGIWGSSGDVAPRGIFGWAYRRTGVGSKEYAAMKLTLYLLFGSAFILVGILALYVAAGSTSFSFLVLEKVRFDPALQSWVFLAFYVGFGILAAIFPFHTWSPDGHASAPTAVSMLHAGVLMKLGAYGVIRVGMGLLPEATHEWMWLVGLIACINIVWGALSAMAQTDLKYVIAYSSVSHMGIVMLGAATLTESGLNGAVFQMFAHGVMTGLFFALVGLVYEKAHSREIFKMGGFATMMPGIAAAFTIGGLSSLGLPATSGFVAEFLTFLGAWASAHPWWLLPGVIGAFLTSLYVLRVVRAIFWGPKSPDPHFQHLSDAQGTEWVALVLLVFVIVLFGIAPGLAISPIDATTVPLLVRLGGALMTAFTELASRPLALELGLFGLLVLVFVTGLTGMGRSSRLPGWVTLGGLALLALAAGMATSGGTAFGGTFVQDDLSLFMKTLFLGSAALSVLAALGLGTVTMTRRAGEYHVALIGSLLGMLVLASARDLILLFVSFELMSIPLYFLAGFERKNESAPEGALKFFLVGSVSSAVILYGLSFVYGATGSTAIAAIGPALETGHPLLLLGLVLTLAGLGFKIAAVPFHMWVPDTYEAAGTPFVAWLSVAPKAAGFIVIIRLYVAGAGPAMLMWVPVAAIIASVTIVAGNLMAIPQQNIKRLLGYSGIAHIGYLLMGLAAMSASGIGMLLFYLVAYLFGNMGAFFVVQAVARVENSDQIDVYSGLARRSPALALSLLVFLLSLGGIPFMAGFWAKLFVFWAVVEKGMYWLAFLGAVATVVALYYYLVVAKRMYIEPPARPDRIEVPGVLFVAIFLCMAGVLIMGLYPDPWVAEALRAAAALF